ncbi:MAG: MCE family protein [Actinobacteria bacterium]|nr:MCE family protein [Actinomycetota bacterium]
MRFNVGVLVKVIVFSIICMLFTVALGMRLSNRGLFVREKLYEAEFENASGVVRGDSVKIAGVDVGVVKGFHIEDGKAVVEFTVKDHVDIPSDSSAAIRWRNVLGQRFLYVLPGTSTEAMEEGDRIPVARTEKAGDIGELLNNLGPILQAIDPDKANAFLDSVNTALLGNEAAARELIDNTAGLASELATVQDRIASVVDSSDEVLNVYASQDDALGQILDHLNNVGGALQSTTSDLNTVLSDFSVVQKHLNRLVTDNRGNIDATLADLSDVSKTLANNKEQLAQTLCTLPQGVAGYFQTTSWGEWFNVRVVEVVVMDNESKTIVSQKETAEQRGEVAPPATTDCGATYKPPPGTTGTEGGLPPEQVTDGMDAILEFLLEEERNDA